VHGTTGPGEADGAAAEWDGTPQPEPLSSRASAAS